MDFKNRTTYSFSVYGAGLIPTDFSRAYVKAIVDAQMARTLGNDIDATQALIRSQLPSNTPANLEDYTFLIVQLPSGQQTAVAVEWINLSTVQVVQSQAVRITTARGITLDDVERIRVFFSSLNINIDLELI